MTTSCTSVLMVNVLGAFWLVVGTSNDVSVVVVTCLDFLN